MADKRPFDKGMSFDEAAFRSRMNQSLSDIEVSDALRNRTLEACRRYLDIQAGETGESGAALERSDAHAHTAVETGGNRRGLLSFTGRHAVFFRVAGGVAACVLLAFMIRDVLPRAGSNDSALFGMQAPAAMPAESSAAAAASMAEDLGEKSESAVAAAGDPDINITFTESAMADAAVGASAKSSDAADAGNETIVAAEGALEVPAPSARNAENGDATMFMVAGLPVWGSLDADAPLLPLPVRPGETLVREALSSQPEVQEWLTAKQAFVMDTDNLLAVYRLAAPLYDDNLRAAGSLTDLLAQADGDADTDVNAGTDVNAETQAIVSNASGLWAARWMLPLTAAHEGALVPLSIATDTDANITVTAGSPLPVANTDQWLQTLSDEDLLRKTLSVSENTSDWYIVDVAGGRGFWVGFKADGIQQVVPFMDNPDALGLENGRIYPWNTLVATVAPHL